MFSPYNVSFQAPFHLRKEKKNPSPFGKSRILFLSLSPSVSVRVTGHYSVHFMEKGGWEQEKIEREKEGARERKRTSSGSGKGNVTGSLVLW